MLFKKIPRDYFFFIDHRVKMEYICIYRKGNLYLEETEPKNFTNCIKDNGFLVRMFYNSNFLRNNFSAI